MALTKLPDFITFKNFNDETFNLIIKKSDELNKLDAFSSFEKFMKVLREDTNLKSIGLEVSEFVDDESNSRILVLSSVSVQLFNDDDVVEYNNKIFDLIVPILNYDELGSVFAIGGLVVGKDDQLSINKLKAIYGVEGLTSFDVKEMVGLSVFSLDQVIEDVHCEIYALHNQVLVLEFLSLFKNDDNLKKICLAIDEVARDPRRVSVGALFFNEEIADEGYGDKLLQKITGFVGDHQFFDVDDIQSSRNMFNIEIEKDNLSDIKKLVRSVFMEPEDANKYFIVLENEMLENRIDKSVSAKINQKRRL